MDIVNPNYLNYMEQIQKNRKDIEHLYDQELSDITQLNFKENGVNGLQYANGKAIFQGKSTIIRDETIENLEVDSKVELKISSSDDNIVIDAGEDNSTLEIHLDNEAKLSLNFAESERQKSKNLLLVVDSSATVYDYTMTCKDGVFTINGGNGSDECTFILSGTGGVKSAPTKYYQSIKLDNTNSIKLSAGTYTISATIPNGQMGILYGDLGTTSQSGASSRSLRANITLTFTKTTYVCVYRYLPGSVMNNVSLGSLQIEEGSTATDYQPYNGAIVHEKDVSDVEHIETIYDYSDTNKQTIDGVAYTNGILFNSSATYTFENLRNKYKGVYIDIKLYTPSNTVTIYIPFTALSIAKSSFVGVNSNVQNNEIAYGVLYFENNILHPANCSSHNFTNTAGLVSDLNNNDKYSIIRIKGVLL